MSAFAPEKGRPRRKAAPRSHLAGALLLAALVTAPIPASGARRFAILASNNEGGPGTMPLRYAHMDAERMRSVLTRLGGVAERDVVLLREGRADDLRRAFDALAPRLVEAAGAGESPVLFVYYSGHAKDGALRMGRTTLGLDELRQLMALSPATIRIGLVDACRSGVVTRVKGAKHAPAFEVDAGSFTGTQGLVFLTSSAENEESQESEALGGSYFSHHLASGLLGAADLSGDGRVTLSEAYAYAYERTVADTAGTTAGTQHPAFSFDLAGKGDFVLTDVVARHEGVVLPAEAPEGSYFLVDSRGAVAAEIAKAAGAERRIALAPGTYVVRRRLADRLRVGEIEVRPRATTVLDESRLRDAPFSDDPVKGARALILQQSVLLGLAGGYQGFFAGPFPSMPLLELELGIRHLVADRTVLGFQLGVGGGEAALALRAAPAVPYRFSQIAAGVSLAREWELGSWVPFAGVRLGMLALSREFDEPGIAKQSYAAFSPGLVAGVRWSPWSGWQASGRVRVHYLYYDVDSTQSLGYVETALVLGYEL